MKFSMGDIEIDADRQRGIIRLGYTKSGKRRGETEEVLITDKYLLELLALVQERSNKGDRLLISEMTSRSEFNVIMKNPALERAGFPPYSLRRGGACHLFLRAGNISIVQARGRRSSLATARIYVNECVAIQKELSLSSSAQHKLALFESHLVSIFM